MKKAKNLSKLNKIQKGGDFTQLGDVCNNKPSANFKNLVCATGYVATGLGQAISNAVGAIQNTVKLGELGVDLVD